MPDPVSEALQPAFTCAPLRRGRFDERRSSRPAVPGFRRRPGPPSSPLVGSKRTQAPDPPRLALARKDKPSGNDRLRGPPGRSKPRSAFPQGCMSIEGEPRNPSTPSSQPSNQGEPRSSCCRTFDAKQAPRLDPFAASNRSKLRSFRRRMSHEKRTPHPPSFAAPSRSKLRSLAAGPSAEARTLRNRPVRGIDWRRTSGLPPPGHPLEGKPCEPRPFAA